jgi:Tol biopolymer transport system component
MEYPFLVRFAYAAPVCAKECVIMESCDHYTHFTHMTPFRLFSRWFALIVAVVYVVGFGAAQAQTPNWIVYAAESSSGLSDLFMLDVNSGRSINLTQTPDINEQAPQWSPDGEQLAYSTAGSEASEGGICILRLGIGSDCFEPFGAEDLSPVWSYDGKWLAISTTDGYVTDIVVVNVETGESFRPLPDVPLQPIMAWSPNALQIALVESSGISMQITIVDVITGESRVVTGAGDWRIESLAWSPDGSRIAFLSDFHIYLVNALGGKAYRLTGDNEVEGLSQGAWSPDGSQLVFITGLGTSEPALNIIDADGTNRRSIPETAGTEFAPVWSTDGTEIAFLNFLGPDSEITLYIYEVETGEIRRITSGGIRFDSLVWYPQ